MWIISLLLCMMSRNNVLMKNCTEDIYYHNVAKFFYYRPFSVSGPTSGTTLTDFARYEAFSPWPHPNKKGLKASYLAGWLHHSHKQPPLLFTFLMFTYERWRKGSDSRHIERNKDCRFAGYFRESHTTLCADANRDDIIYSKIVTWNGSCIHGFMTIIDYL